MTFVLNEVPSFAAGQKPISPISVLSNDDVIRPGKDFLAPSSSFFFASEPQHSSFMSYLPSQNVADSLLSQYWNCVHYMCRVLHRPTFERQYISFWQQVQGGIEPPASLQALVFSVMLSATSSLDDGQIAMEFGVEKKQLIESFQQGTESALYRANFLRTTKLQTLQALVLYLVSETHFAASHPPNMKYRFLFAEQKSHEPIQHLLELQSDLRSAWVYIVMELIMAYRQSKCMSGG